MRSSNAHGHLPAKRNRIHLAACFMLNLGQGTSTERCLQHSWLNSSTSAPGDDTCISASELETCYVRPHAALMNPTQLPWQVAVVYAVSLPACSTYTHTAGCPNEHNGDSGHAGLLPASFMPGV
jgi:hypothetical protein